jgi:hypothetical protein
LQEVEVEEQVVGYLEGAGGGGAGGYRTSCSISVCGATGYPITVGAGGAGTTQHGAVKV